MKKLIFLFSVLSLTLTSCGNDDNDDSSGTDPFIGVWKLLQSFENGTEQTLDTCELMETLVVSAKGTFTTEDFEDNGSGVCESSDSSNGLWENFGNNSYRITTNADTPSKEEFTANITFSNNTFSLTATQDGDTFRLVYQRQ